MMNEMEPWKLVAEAQRRCDIEVIKARMLAWGHHNAPGCVCCITARGLIEAIEEGALTRTAAKKSVVSDDGVVVTVYEAGK